MCIKTQDKVKLVAHPFAHLLLGVPQLFIKEESEALLFLSFFFAKPLRLSRLIGEDYGPRPGRF